MAKFECSLKGNFDELLQAIETGILTGSMSAKFEDGSDWESSGIRCAVRVFERFSMIGGNRVSMNVTILGNVEELFVSAITSGGSKAVFFKINTWGEESFLDCIREIVNDFSK